ncbi:Dicer-like protein 2 [Exophiala oligosperma]
MPHASEETWSDSESEADDVLETPLRSYAYQIEMFEQSLQGNIIAVLPAFNFRLITGMDNADHWKTNDIWNKVLFKIDVVVSTPQILLDALDYGFVSLKEISLLVIDEAHHCVGDSPLKRVMERHYHGSLDSLPHILGLSASPITKRNVSEMSTLETSLKAKWKMPTQQVEEYTSLIRMPELETIMFAESLLGASEWMILLQKTVSVLSLDSDPFYQYIIGKTDPSSQEKLKKMLGRNATPAITELRAFARSCGAIHFFSSVLQPVSEVIGLRDSGALMEGCLSPKVEALLNYLAKEYRPTLRALVFVEKRATAWALTEVITRHPRMQMYQAFSFVGVSSPGHQGPFDFTELPVQTKSLERFRRGELNLCIATSVLEEGIDVPAMNLVICFDERKNLRSYVQSRGRARAAKSKFVVFRPLEETDIKMKSWDKLEQAMKQECEDSADALAELQAAEMRQESSSDIFRVASTGATLTYDNAQPRLQHFCAKLPQKEGMAVPELAYCIEGEIGGPLSAKVYLPSSLAPELQVFQSESTWYTQRMAKRDAAYQAYLALYRAGLVTEHLLPLERSNNGNKARKYKTKSGAVSDGLCAVEAQWDPWSRVTEQWLSSTEMFAHRLHIQDETDAYPRMFILLPTKLGSISFPLYISANKITQASINEGEPVSGIPIALAQEITFSLLTSVLERRLRDVTKEQLPLLIVPDIGSYSLRDWHSENSLSTPLLELLVKGGGLASERYLIRDRNRLTPLVLVAQGATSLTMGAKAEPESLTVTASTITRKLEYLSPPSPTNLTKPIQQRTLLVKDCVVMSLPPGYGEMMLFAPSITHMVETALRSSEACRGPLSGLQFTNIDLVSEALTLPAASARNYQRLEFLGDDLLKLHASLQLYVDNPTHPESLLTTARGRLVSNGRLLRTTRKLGLDRYMTQRAFSSAQWKAGVNPSNNQTTISSKTKLSRKTLADIIEALIGAAHCDGVPTGTSEAKVVGALRLFLSEVQWRPVSENLARLEIKEDDPSSLSSGLDNTLDHFRLLTGYKFTHPSLLFEALTQSSLRPGVLSYERLEFLGDAILDHIVKTKLYDSPLRLDPEAMTVRRHALVSHVTLAFFALEASHERRTVEVHTDVRTHETTAREVSEIYYLPDYIRRISRDADQREFTLKAFEEGRESILVSLFGVGGRRHFPWSELSHLRAPKSYSDVVESVLAAVFIDSKGDLTRCESVLDRLGFMGLLDRFAQEPDLDVMHPEERLSKVKLGCDLVVGETRSGWRCKVTFGHDERVIAFARKASCRDEARCRAAEKAVRVILTEKEKGGEVSNTTEDERLRENHDNEADRQADGNPHEPGETDGDTTETDSNDDSDADVTDDYEIYEDDDYDYEF